MESLVGYESDDDFDEHSQLKKRTKISQLGNVEEAPMDLSEESDDSINREKRRKSKKESKHKLKSKSKRHGRKKLRLSEDWKHNESNGSSSKHHHRDGNYKHKSHKEDKKYRDKKYKEEHGRHSRKNKDDKDKYSRSYRESSRERQRSRSPKRFDYERRSSSPERSRQKRYDRTSNKMDRLEKLGIELGTSGTESAGTSFKMYSNNTEVHEKNRFFMPGITGRFTEQIQRRKLLWQKKEKTDTLSDVPSSTHQGQKVWQNTTFAQDTDGKVANKFKRLMGIREQQSSAQKSATDSLKKQEEMFSSMEAQYEVARTATHTMRGVGLGFGSFQK